VGSFLKGGKMTSLIERIERARREQEKQAIERKKKAEERTLLEEQKKAEFVAEVQLRADPLINIIKELQIIDLFRELIERYNLKAQWEGHTPAKIRMSYHLSRFSEEIDVQTGKIFSRWRDSLDAYLEKIDCLKKGKNEVKDVECELTWNQSSWGGGDLGGGSYDKISVCLVKEKNDLLLKITPGEKDDKTLILTESEWRDKEKVVDALARVYMMGTCYRWEDRSPIGSVYNF